MDINLGHAEMRASSSRTVRSSGATQGCLFAEPLRMPAGFAYRDELISLTQEQALLQQFETLPLKPFESRDIWENGASFRLAGIMISMQRHSVRANRCHPSFTHCETRRQPLQASHLTAFSRFSSTNMRRALVSAGIGTGQCSRMSSGSRSPRPARCGFVSGQRQAGSEHPRYWHPAPPISCADRHDRIGSIASRRLNSCATPSPSAILPPVPQRKTSWSKTDWIALEPPTDIIPIVDGPRLLMVNVLSSGSSPSTPAGLGK